MKEEAYIKIISFFLIFFKIISTREIVKVFIFNIILIIVGPVGHTIHHVFFLFDSQNIGKY